MLAGTTASVASAGWRRAAARISDALRAEVELTASAADVHRGLAELDRERASLQYTASVLDHAGRESMRRLDAYRSTRSERERRARDQARVLYKLSRGGLARLAFEDLGTQEHQSAERIRHGRLLRFVIRHDLRELAVHRRAEQRASAELVASTRELQALSALTLVHAMQEHALVSTEFALDPALAKAQRRRRQVLKQPGDRARRANRELLRLLWANYEELEALRGLDGAADLIRPVRGPTVGAFGEYEDRVLRVPMVRNGVELQARRNERVRAMAGGRVVMVTTLPGYEQVVVIDHGGGQYTLTARLWQVEVAEGDEVDGGEVIGRVAPKSIDDGLGRTVYIELRHGEKPLDPTPYLRRARR